MSDGAAALYAGGATGAINIVLRRGFEGATAWAGAERPGQRGGEIENAGALWGGKVGRGRLTIGVNGFRRAEIRSKDRAYSRASWADGGSFAGTAGLNEGGNTLYFRDDEGTPGDPADDTTVARSLGACSGGGYTGTLSNPFGIPGTGCGFAYADISWETVRVGRYSLFANFDHPLDNAATFYAAARFAQGETADRFAPPVGEFEFEPSQELRTRLLAEQDISTVPDKLNVAHRFTAHGNRDWITDLLEYDVTAGLRGRLGAGVGYDMHLRNNRVAALERAGKFVSESLIQAAIADNSYYLEDPLNPPESRAAAHRQAIRDTTVRLKRDTVSQRRTARFALNGPGRALPGGPLRWAAGMEVDHREERSIRTYRSGSGTHDVSDVLGSGGTSYTGERLRWSAFGEIRLPLHRDWTVALAARHDRYDDVGPAWSYQVASVYRLHKVLSLRGSWETGRTPPGFRGLHRPREINHTNYEDCDPETRQCTDRMYEIVSGGNTSLTPHRTQTCTLGAKAILGKLSVAVDWFRIEASETPGQLTRAQLFALYDAGRALPPGAALQFAPAAASQGSPIRSPMSGNPKSRDWTSAPAPDGRPTGSIPASICAGCTCSNPGPGSAESSSPAISRATASTPR